MTTCPFTFRDGSPCRLPAGHDSWHNATPTRPQPFDPDPLTVEDDRIPKPYRVVADSPRRGCSVIPWLLVALFWGAVAACVVTR